MEAGGLIEEVLDVGHKVHWTGLLEGQGFPLMLDEVVKEPLLNPRPLCLCKGGNTEPVVDPEDMLQVLHPLLQKFAANLAGSRRADLG